MTQNATVKKNQNEINEMTIVAQCIYEGTTDFLEDTLPHLVRT